jgi:5-methylcytosine-specific restriction enzyme subunit McrC
MTRVVPYGTPTTSDEQLASHLRVGPGFVDVDWLHDGEMRVTTKAWVGVIRFSRVELRIVPKLVGGDLGVLAMFSYCSGWKSLTHLNSLRTLATGGANLLDLVCHLLSDAASTLIREGLLQDYVAREELLPALRGRLRFRDQAMKRFGVMNVLECAFDEFESDILENQIIGAGLRRARSLATDDVVRERSGRLESAFAEVCASANLDPNTARQQLVYHRRNEQYRSAHQWAFLLFEGRAVSEFFDAGDSDAPVFLLDMNRLFERFVTKLISDAYAGSLVHVAAQRRTPAVIVNEATLGTYSTLVPDLLLHAGPPTNRVLPLDAKYKLYDVAKVSPADIYQTFMYAIAFADALGPTPTSVIIYPGDVTGTSTQLAILRVNAPRARIFCLSLNVPEALENLAPTAGYSGTLSRTLVKLKGLCDECLASA